VRRPLIVCRKYGISSATFWGTGEPLPLHCSTPELAASRWYQASDPAPTADGALVTQARVFRVRPRRVMLPVRTCCLPFCTSPYIPRGLCLVVALIFLRLVQSKIVSNELLLPVATCLCGVKLIDFHNRALL